MSTEMLRLYNPFATAAKQARGLEEVGHRPWPLPDGPWRMGQSWLRLLFMHWAVPEEALRPHIPRGLELDVFDGSAWLGITPFRLEGMRPRRVPPAPLLCDFLEANSRTYVTAGGKPGIWFFTLDASSRVAAAGGRLTYRLPYRHVQMTMREDDGRYAFASDRLRVRYRSTGTPRPAAPGSLEHFLTERYCLYAQDGEAVYRAEIHHPPWPLQPAEAELEHTAMPPGVAPPGEPLLHFAERQDVVVWPLEAV
jgi:uncharacterized protein YqjF (DUF2071 family)